MSLNIIDFFQEFFAYSSAVYDSEEKMNFGMLACTPVT